MGGSEWYLFTKFLGCSDRAIVSGFGLKIGVSEMSCSSSFIWSFGFSPPVVDGGAVPAKDGRAVPVVDGNAVDGCDLNVAGGGFEYME